MRTQASRPSSFAAPRLPAVNDAAAGPFVGPARSPSFPEIHAGGDLPGVEVARMGVSSLTWPLSRRGEGSFLDARSALPVRAASARQSQQLALRHRRVRGLAKALRNAAHRPLVLRSRRRPAPLHGHPWTMERAAWASPIRRHFIIGERA